MQQREIEIVNKLGLHARASAKLTQLAAKYQCDVSLARSGRKVNAKSIMGVMMLGRQGQPHHARNRRSGRNRGDGRDRRADRRLFRRGTVTLDSGWRETAYNVWYTPGTNARKQGSMNECLPFALDRSPTVVPERHSSAGEYAGKLAADPKLDVSAPSF